MGINELLAQMKADATMLSLPEKLLGGLVVTILSMAIVFIVLIIIMYSIKLMTKIAVKETKTSEKVTEPVIEKITEDKIENTNYEEEIAAVIAAISSMSSVGPNKLVIRNITKKAENNWSVQGRFNQIQNKL